MCKYILSLTFLKKRPFFWDQGQFFLTCEQMHQPVFMVARNGHHVRLPTQHDQQQWLTSSVSLSTKRCLTNEKRIIKSRISKTTYGKASLISGAGLVAAALSSHIETLESGKEPPTVPATSEPTLVHFQLFYEEVKVSKLCHCLIFRRFSRKLWRVLMRTFLVFVLFIQYVCGVQRSLCLSSNGIGAAKTFHI